MSFESYKRTENIIGAVTILGMFSLLAWALAHMFGQSFLLTLLLVIGLFLLVSLVIMLRMRLTSAKKKDGV